MQIGDLLVASGLATIEQVECARERQKEQGGRLGDNLVEMGVITAEQLEGIIHSKPPAPKSIEDTKVTLGNLLKLLLKTVYASNIETPAQMEAATKLPGNIIMLLLDEAVDRKLAQVLGQSAERMGQSDMPSMSDTRYELSVEGRNLASELLQLNQYTGPAPVALADYTERILRQRITNERISKDMIEESFTNLVVDPDFVRRLGPAINSGRCILLYGPPGNGKTTVAEKVGRIFTDIIYIPYAVEVDGQIIKVFDPSIHDEVVPPSAARRRAISLKVDDVDRRWVPCKRPIIVAGGELTLDMLDLKFNSFAKFYEAPLHLKALGGTFIIDDFGRQIVKPEDLLNRWIVPLQSRVDYLKLHTGKSFQVPFDELVIFSTNLAPGDLMDPAFLRRIPYKLKTVGPSVSDYRAIFDKVAEAQGLEVSDDIFQFVLNELRANQKDLACYQPTFIIEQIVAACKYDGTSPKFSRDLVASALSNLYVKAEEDDAGGPTAASAARDAA